MWPDAINLGFFTFSVSSVSITPTCARRSWCAPRSTLPPAALTRSSMETKRWCQTEATRPLHRALEMSHQRPLAFPRQPSTRSQMARMAQAPSTVQLPPQVRRRHRKLWTLSNPRSVSFAWRKRYSFAVLFQNMFLIHPLFWFSFVSVRHHLPPVWTRLLLLELRKRSFRLSSLQGRHQAESKTLLRG